MIRYSAMTAVALAAALSFPDTALAQQERRTTTEAIAIERVPEAGHAPSILHDILDRLDALETQNAALQSALVAEIAARQNSDALLANVLVHFSRVGNDIFITGANLHIVNGTGDTKATNGLGNLIVGYNAPRDPMTGIEPDDRTGSHMLVTGDENNYSSYGGLVAGFRNSTEGIFSSVSAGRSNTASGDYSSVSGGTNNTAEGVFSSVSGGGDVTPESGNTASGFASSVSGGQANTASGHRSSVSGGRLNTAGGDFSSVSGGRGNTASGHRSSVTGGRDNTASGTHAVVSGGVGSLASGMSASVSGGEHNTASGPYASVSGGYENVAIGSFSSVSGGFKRVAEGFVDWVAGLLFQDM